MPTTSTVPALKAALVTAIRAQAGTVQVERRWPGPDTEAEGIYLGDVAGTSKLSALTATGSRARRREEYRVEIICQTFRSSDSPITADEAEDRVYELFAFVENAVAADPDVNATVEWGEVSAFEDTTVPFQAGWACRLTAQFSCTARLT